MVEWYGRLLWQNGMVEWYGRMVWQNGMVEWYGRMVWQLFSSFPRYTNPFKISFFKTSGIWSLCCRFATFWQATFE